MEEAAPILSKSQNHQLWQSGAFGNKLRAWHSLAEWRESGYRGKVALRTILPHGGGACIYDIDPLVLKSSYDTLARGVLPEHIIICEAAPAEVVILQGEYANRVHDNADGTSSWDYFYYSRARRQMRDALREEHSVIEGLRARLLIERSLTPASHLDWLILIDRYPDHVLEVSIYDRCIGDVPGRNALVWEVRRY